MDFAPIWSKKCAKCHGLNGKGKLEGVPDLTLPLTVDKSNSKIVEIITNGKKGKTDDDEDMPSFKGKLTPEEIEAAAKYVKKLGGY
ncbi:MAG: cytochrome c [Ignavibacteria bacterium]|nr:cytochrome c [Ignavibacteria bacterium]